MKWQSTTSCSLWLAVNANCVLVMANGSAGEGFSLFVKSNKV
jgi:hypothetical protein